MLNTDKPVEKVGRYKRHNTHAKLQVEDRRNLQFLSVIMHFQMQKTHAYFTSMSYEKADGFKIRDQSAPHFLTFTIEGWIDIFTSQLYRDILLEACIIAHCIKYYQ